MSQQAFDSAKEESGKEATHEKPVGSMQIHCVYIPPNHGLKGHLKWATD